MSLTDSELPEYVNRAARIVEWWERRLESKSSDPNTDGRDWWQHFLAPKMPDHIVEGDRIIKWWENFLAAIIGVSTFGGSITFSLIISDIADPAKLNATATEDTTPTRYDRETVRWFLAVSWMVFIGELGLCGLLAMLIGFMRDELVRTFASKSTDFTKRSFALGCIRINTEWCFHAFSLFINGFIVIAFIFLSLAVVAYVHFAGWMGVAMTSLYGLVVLALWLNQSASAVKTWRKIRSEKKSQERARNPKASHSSALAQDTEGESSPSDRGSKGPPTG